MAETRRIGRYEVLDELGRGGMGAVLRARDTVLDRDVALKLIARGAEKPERRERFRREVKILSRLKDPAIVNVHDVLEWEGDLVIVMELVEGRNLAEVLENGPLFLAEALPFLIQIAKGLGAAHEKGIIHRDLKAENVMITPSRDVKIVDFGIAKFLFDGITDLTEAGRLLGTFDYMAPEQIQGEPVDQRTDIWALGVLSYMLLTGEKPFTGANPRELFAQVLGNKQLEAWRFYPATPEKLSMLVDRMLEKDRLLSRICG